MTCKSKQLKRHKEAHFSKNGRGLVASTKGQVVKLVGGFSPQDIRFGILDRSVCIEGSTCDCKWDDSLVYLRSCIHCQGYRGHYCLWLWVQHLVSVFLPLSQSSFLYMACLPWLLLRSKDMSSRCLFVLLSSDELHLIQPFAWQGQNESRAPPCLP